MWDMFARFCTAPKRKFENLRLRSFQVKLMQLFPEPKLCNNSTNIHKKSET